MVYNFDKYVEQFPKRNVSIIKKFESEAKNLHEMSTDEINSIISTWGAVIPATATNQKSIISLYFDWLKKEGIPVKADIDGIVIPVKSTEFLIYSSEMLHEYWNKFFKSCEREAAKSGKSFGRDRYLASYVAGILSFYGLTSEQILALDLSDVQPDGVAGYSIPLTQNDLDVLIEYKNLKEFSNNKKVNGYKYIRAASTVNEETLDRGINHGACESKDKYLKRLLTFKNAYKLGRYAEIYAEEKCTGKLVDLSNRVIPVDWFLKKIELIVGSELKTNRITAYKKDYEAYRSERMEYEAKHGSQIVNVVSNPPVVEKKPDVNELLESLKYIDSTIAEIEKIKTNLLGIKAQIQKFIK
jgi:hypothetical protein